MCSRRNFMGVIPVSAFAVSSATSAAMSNQTQDDKAKHDLNSPLIASPPVVQNPRANGFGVSVAVAGLATALVEYGFSEDNLCFTATASHRGLMQADDRVLHIRVNHKETLPTDRPVFYRVVVQPLKYLNAY